MIHFIVLLLICYFILSFLLIILTANNVFNWISFY